MNLQSAIEHVLENADGPVHYREIWNQIKEQGLWTTTGNTPSATVNARLSINRDRFRKTSPGYYELNVSGSDASSGISHREPTSRMTYLEAAEKILRRENHEDGMH